MVPEEKDTKKLTEFTYAVGAFLTPYQKWVSKKKMGIIDN